MDVHKKISQSIKVILFQMFIVKHSKEVDIFDKVQYRIYGIDFDAPRIKQRNSSMKLIAAVSIHIDFNLYQEKSIKP